MNKEPIFLVYRTTNIINGKTYVGYHKTYNIDDGYLGSGTLIKKAIEKYGPENFSREILKKFSSSAEAEEYEATIVNKEFVLRDDTYNLSLGGNVRSMPGKNNPFFGKTHSDETRRLLSVKRTGVKGKNSNKIIHSDGRIFHNVDDVLNKIPELNGPNKYASRMNVLIECGTNSGCLSFVDELPQKNAEEFVIKKLEREETKDLRREEQYRNLSKSLKGKKKSPEAGIKISKALTEKKKTTDHINKINLNPDKIRKTAEAHRGMKRSDESKRRMSLAKAGKTAKNKGKKFFTNPNNKSERGYFLEHEIPEGWVNRVL